MSTSIGDQDSLTIAKPVGAGPLGLGGERHRGEPADVAPGGRGAV